ncbi:MAG: glycosyltransferase family 4 protein [Verrucomicrobiae bacterium]|nr:glycosyltransferase family 4 protein [Verrucomicrobiae bacterium]
MPTTASSTTVHRPWRIAHSEVSLGWGGQEHRVLAELTGFARRGAQVWLLAPPESCLYCRAREAGIPVVPLRLSRLAFPWRAIQWARWLKANRIEVLNPHSSRDGWLLGIAGRLARVPFIVRTRHIDVDYPHAWLSRHAFTTLADHVLTTSEKIAAHFRALFDLPAERVTTIPTGIDVQRFSPAGPKAALIPAATTPPLVGMVSVLRSWKGHATFLQAARQLVDAGFPARFVIVGEGPIRYQIEAQIAELQLQQQVVLTGHREDVPEVLRALDVLVIASTRHEGVPQIGLQALACETPVIGSDVGGTPEIIRPGETGRIFPAGNAAALAQAIRETLAQPEITRAMCRRGREMVVKHHSLEHMLDQLEQLYQRHLPG